MTIKPEDRLPIANYKVFGINFLTVGRVRLIIFIALGLVVLLGFTLFILGGGFGPRVAGFNVNTNPQSYVWLNNQQVGRTPYEGTVQPGEAVIRLVPDSFDVPLAPYETRINFVRGVETVIRYDFGAVEELSAGDIISFEKVQRGETSLVLVSIPDSAEVVINGQERVFTPHKTSAITPGRHTLAFSAQGYISRTVEVVTHQGYKLSAIIKLAKDQEQERLQEFQDEVETEEEDEGLGKVEILDTSTGFLRVRAEPSTIGREIGRVIPGEEYRLIDTDEQTGWYKIEYEEEQEGWISNQYAKRVGENENSLSPTPTSAVGT